MTKRRWLLLALVVLIGAVGYARFGTHYAPAGQPPLTYLDVESLTTLKDDFNRASDATRLIVLLSPT